MRNRRKKRFIDSAVQGAIGRRIALHWLMFFAMAFLTLPLWRLMSSTEFTGPFSTLLLRSWAETAPVLVILIAMLPIFVWDTVKFSHRFAGPMYRFHKTVKSLSAGEEVQPIRLRKGDFWMDVADDFNSMIERLTSERNQRASATDWDDTACGACGGDKDSVGEVSRI